MNPPFHALAVVISLCAICLIAIEYRVREIANEMRRSRIEMEQKKKARIREYQKKEIDRFRQKLKA